MEIAYLGNAWKNEWKNEKKPGLCFSEEEIIQMVLPFCLESYIRGTQRMASKDSMNGQSNNLPLVELINSFSLSFFFARPVLSSPHPSPPNLYTSSTVITIQGRGNRKFSTPRDKRN